MWTWWMAGLSAAAGQGQLSSLKLTGTESKGQATWARILHTPVAENSGARQCSRAVACLTELAVLPTVMAKLYDARAATTAKTTPGH